MALSPPFPFLSTFLPYALSPFLSTFPPPILVPFSPLPEGPHSQLEGLASQVL